MISDLLYHIMASSGIYAGQTSFFYSRAVALAVKEYPASFFVVLLLVTTVSFSRRIASAVCVHSSIVPFLHNWVSRLASTFTIFSQPFWVVDRDIGFNPSVIARHTLPQRFASYTLSSTHTFPLHIPLIYMYPFIYPYLPSTELPKCHRGDMRGEGLNKSPIKYVEAGRSSMKIKIGRYNI